MSLSPKQLKFIDEYFANNFNGTQAAISAGYKPNSANEQAAQLLARLSIKSEVEKRKKELAEKYAWSREDSIRTLKEVIAKPDRKSDITTAIKLLNQMGGYDAPVKVEHSGLISVVKRVIVDPATPVATTPENAPKGV